tara:strand:- start:3399 stop:4037 length:639 start_codon:yes stop_codon:yes gene_type:complete
MKDYEVTVKVRNNWMLKRMAMKGMYTAADLHRASGLQQGVIGDMLNLTRPFIRTNGEWLPSVIKASEALQCLPEDLVPPQHIAERLAKSTAKFEASFEEVQALSYQQTETDPLAIVFDKEREQIISAIIKGRLSKREQLVVEMSFGLNGREQSTFKKIGKEIGVSLERARQINAKALRKLSSPTAYEPISGTRRPDHFSSLTKQLRKLHHDC